MERSEAIEIVREYYPSSGKDLNEALETLVPELKESEDERIRKELIQYLKDYPNLPNGIYCRNDFFAWLEKQGENVYNEELSKSLHEVICYFINNQNIPYLKREIVSKKIIPYVEKLEKQGSQNLANSAKTCKDEPKFKVGDVIRNKWSNRTKTIIAIDNSQYTLDDGMPAQPLKVNIKAQDNWEFVEQNLAWSEEEKPLLEKFKQAVYDCAWGKVTCKAKGETKEEYANRWAEHFLLMVRDWADDYIDYASQQKLRKSYDKGKEDTIKTNSPAWSEEDEVKFRDVIRLVEQGAPVQSIRDHYTNWLKSLKDRVQPKPKQEWSEDDENALRVVTNIFEQYGVKLSCYPAFVHWLKTLPNRITFNPYWKPSDEQMDALYTYIYNPQHFNSPDPRMELVVSVYNDLKKLKG